MKVSKAIVTRLALTLVLAGLVFTGCASQKAPAVPPGTPFECVAEGDLEKMIVPEAELVEFSCMFKKWEGSDTLHFTVGVKNVSDQDQRFRVNIFLDNGKAVGGLIPRKTKKGLIKPGQVGSFVYPVSGMPDKPKSITLKISTSSP
jgi:hypothetical protein